MHLISIGREAFQRWILLPNLVNCDCLLTSRALIIFPTWKRKITSRKRAIQILLILFSAFHCLRGDEDYDREWNEKKKVSFSYESAHLKWLSFKTCREFDGWIYEVFNAILSVVFCLVWNFLYEIPRLFSWLKRLMTVECESSGVRRGFKRD